MKINFLNKLALITVLFLSATTASAHDFEVNGIFYNKNSDGTSVSVTYKGIHYDSYDNEYSGAVTIPASVTYSGKTYSVSSIGDNAFAGCSGLTSVSIGNFVTSIGESAFYSCNSLTSVSIGNSVTTIGKWAFCSCWRLTSVVIPNSVTSIGNMAFNDCFGLASVSIGNSVTEIGESAFCGCWHLSSVEIPNSVTYIGDRAFYGCNSLASVVIPNSVIYIGSKTFYECSSLTSVSIGNSVSTIGKYAFYGCSSLTSVSIGNSVTEIGDRVFYGCSSLTSVEIPNSVTEIGSEALYGCSNLTSVSIGNSVTEIGKDAFYKCSGLKKVEISDLEAWCKISFSNETANPIYYSHNLFRNGHEIKNLIIPETVQELKSYVFSGCSGLTSVEIPNSVTYIGSEAFDGCSGLTSVVIPNSVTSIGNMAFYDCFGLASVSIGNSVTSIGESAFCSCWHLSSVEIPNSVTSISKEAFYGCNSLASVVIPNSVTTIGSEAFYGCSSLALVVIGNSVTTIGKEAFRNCSNLKTMFYNATNSTCGDYVFNTSGYTFVIGENVTKLPNKLLSSYFSGKIVSLASVPPVISATTFPSSSTVYVSSDDYISYWTDEKWGKMTLQEISTPVTSIALNAESLHITTTTKSASLEATVTPADATLKDLYWTSSDPLIATVDQNGLVTRRREGSATITACAIDGSGAMATCQVTVDAIIAESLELSPAELSLSPNKSYRINAIYTPDDISSKNFEWSCSDEGVATFIKNLDGSITVTAIADGNATITCRTTDGSNLTATCEVTVVTESLELDPSEITISKNQTAVIKPVFLPAGTPNRPCEWSCSDENVVKYKANSDGSITIIGAVSDGEAIITCHTTDGSNLTATCTVTVGTGAVDGIEADAVTVRGENGVIRVEGVDGARVEVFNTAGVCIYSGTDTEIYVPQRGLYVVKVAGRATKLAL